MRDRVDVARDHEAGVRRRVVGPEEVDDVFIAGGGQVLHVADHRPVIRMAFRIEHLVQRDVGHAVRAVLVALTPLVLHDVALQVHGLRRHRVEQVAHAVRFQEERELERVRRHVDVVVGPVVGGRGVVPAADRFERVSNSPYGTCPEPMNIRCSNRCAKPVRPGSSFADPTRYQVLTVTIGTL